MALALTVVAPYEIIKEGWLQKKGNYIRSWKARWIVLTSRNVYTFENENEYTNPTQTMELSSIVSITATEQQNEFYIQSDQFFYTYFKCDSVSERNEWMNIVKGYKHSIQVSVTMDCVEEKDYSCEFELSVPYHNDYKYEINTMVSDAVQYLQRKHHAIKFYATHIKQESFIEHNVYDWKHCNADIMDYPKQVIISKGIHISIDIGNNLCPNMVNDNELCPIYVSIRDEDENEMTEVNLSHLFEFNHFENEFVDKSECKQGEECIAYNRLLNGGNQLKDRCHVKIYRHHHLVPLHSINASQESIQNDILKNGEILSKLNEKLEAIDIKKWENSRNYAVLQIMTLADALEKVIRDVGIAKTTGGGTTIVGGVLTLVGLGLAPVSAGVSLGLSVAGMSTMVAGGLTTIGSEIVKMVIENGTVKRCVKAYEDIQPETRKISFLLDDYDQTFTATAHNISVFKSLCLASNTGSNIKKVTDLYTVSKAVRGYRALRLAATVTDDVIIDFGETTLFSGLKFGQKVIYEPGGVVARSLGWIGGALGVASGIWDMVEGIKTIQDAENAIHRLRVLAIEVDKQTETIMNGYNKIFKI